MSILEENKVLKNLIFGKWVDCELVCKALNIDFSTGLKMFDFGRMAEWCKAPLNGQKITTKFKLKHSKDADFYEELEDFETANESGWVPVEERFPEDSYEVLMCVELSPDVTCVTVGICMYYDNDDKPQEWITTTGEKLEKAYEDFIGTHQTAYSQPRVTAWQPLPQPYVNKEN